MKEIESKLAAFAALLQAQQREKFDREYPAIAARGDSGRYTNTKVTVGPKYAKIDVGISGRYMVEMSTGNIYGIKAYGVIHRGHQYGNLDTINQWDWSGYVARMTEYVSS